MGASRQQFKAMGMGKCSRKACRLDTKPQGDTHRKGWAGKKGNCKAWASSKEKLEATVSQTAVAKRSVTQGKGSSAKGNKGLHVGRGL